MSDAVGKTVKQSRSGNSAIDTGSKAITNKEIGRRIRKIRKDLGLSMEEFSKNIDEKARSGSVGNWELGRHLPNNERLKRIAELGGISVDDLLNGGGIVKLTNEQITEINRFYSMVYDIEYDVDGVALSAIENILDVLGIDSSFLKYEAINKN